MAHLPHAEILARRAAASQEIVEEWQSNPGAEVYIIMCPCRIDCGCMSEVEFPRIILNCCMFVGELDFFVVHQPFRNQYGFDVRWHCDECLAEMCCGFPGML